MVRVRMFAALREAAGTGEVEVPAGTLGSVTAALEARYGASFAEVLRHASVLVDGDRRDDPATPVPDGAEVALLPPFSGGAGTV